MSKQALSKSEVNKWNRVNTQLYKVNEKDVLKRQIEIITKNIKTISYRRVVASIALCKYYSLRAKETFRRFQAFQTFWNNQTGSAYSSVFSEVIASDKEIGFLIAHQVEYGIYLELANDRKHESLWPIIRDLDSQFEIDLHKIWG